MNTGRILRALEYLNDDCDDPELNEIMYQIRRRTPVNERKRMDLAVKTYCLIIHDRVLNWRM